jgi:mannose-6-phosphate isomerase-like protein (cupin superfamily)
VEFFVLEGRGSFTLGEESTEAGAGSLLPSPRGVPHGMKNAGPGILRVLAIKNPRPEGE